MDSTYYNINIYDRFNDLLKSGKKEFNNTDLWKIFEYFTCIKLNNSVSDNYPFYLNEDIDPNFKEENEMSKIDTGIDACNLKDTIVQIKLRNNLNLKDISTFLASQNIYDEKLKTFIIRWQKLILARNNDSVLSKHLLNKKGLIHYIYSKEEILKYCYNLIHNPPIIKNENKDEERNYQNECIELIKNSSDKNIIINLPTGSGKTKICIKSLIKNKKYLILVPKIILMEQWFDEINKLLEFKNKICCIGDSEFVFDNKKDIFICVYNSIFSIPELKFKSFEKIFIDEAHRINIPEIYQLFDPFIINDNEDNIDQQQDESDDEEGSENEEEKKENKMNYIEKIKKLTKYNNNVYLSATIDKHEGFLYYSKNIREMIEKGYLCDYTINVPIFNTDPTDYNICKYLIQNHRSIIIYCSCQNEGKKINDILNKIQPYCSDYIDCNTSKKNRNIIINKYKKGEIAFLVNVKILVEGFDSPNTRGIVFYHLPSSDNLIIQIIGRALRKNENKKIANIILPFCKDEDSDNIMKIINIIANNDSRIKKSILNKNTNGYISLEKINNLNQDDEIKDDVEDINELDDETKENDEINLRYELIYDSFGKCLNGTDYLILKLNEIREFYKENNRIPKEIRKNNRNEQELNEYMLRKKLTHLIYNYKNNIYNMSNKNNRIIFELFCKELNINISKTKKLSSEENYKENKILLEQFIKENNRLPKRNEKEKDNEEYKLCRWLDGIINRYKNNKMNIERKNSFETLCKELNINISKTKKLSSEENYKENKILLEQFIKENNKFPQFIKDKTKLEYKLSKWLSSNKLKYKKNKMNIEIKNDFELFCKNNNIKLDNILLE